MRESPRRTITLPQAIDDAVAARAAADGTNFSQVLAAAAAAYCGVPHAPLKPGNPLEKRPARKTLGTTTKKKRS